jgi:hypothetical protein
LPVLLLRSVRLLPADSPRPHQRLPQRLWLLPALLPHLLLPALLQAGLLPALLQAGLLPALLQAGLLHPLLLALLPLSPVALGPTARDSAAGRDSGSRNAVADDRGTVPR